METANSVVKSALEEIQVQANEQPLASVDFQRGIQYLNRMMAAWDAQGLSLGYTAVSNAAAPITVSDGAIEGIVFNLALKLAPTYDIPISQDLRQNASSGLDAIRHISVTVQPSQMPCTMPIGSGNEGQYVDNNYHFYSCPDDEVLTERDGSILVEKNNV